MVMRKSIGCLTNVSSSHLLGPMEMKMHNRILWQSQLSFINDSVYIQYHTTGNPHRPTQILQLMKDNYW